MTVIEIIYMALTTWLRLYFYFNILLLLSIKCLFCLVNKWFLHELMLICKCIIIHCRQLHKIHLFFFSANLFIFHFLALSKMNLKRTHFLIYEILKIIEIKVLLKNSIAKKQIKLQIILFKSWLIIRKNKLDRICIYVCKIL